jgi:hypothetical protein
MGSPERVGSILARYGWDGDVMDGPRSQLRATHNDLTQDEWRQLCLRAFENLQTDTTVTMGDVDAILTWCLPEYDRLITEHRDP